MHRLLPNLLIIIFLFSAISHASSLDIWNGKRAAVVLTYDDALNVHLDKVVPALNQRNFHGTFYISVNSWPFTSRVNDWRSAAANGHELGNHTLFHPCAGSLPGREWVNADYDLSKYSVQKIVDEISLASRLLEAVDGKQDRTFAYPCGDTQAKDGSFVEKLKPMFVGARGVANNFTQINKADLYNINAFGVYKHSGQELIAKAKQALQEGTLLVYLFHGVGGEHSLNVSESAHTELLDFLQEHQAEIWITTMVDAARHIRQQSITGGKK